MEKKGRRQKKKSVNQRQQKVGEKDISAALRSEILLEKPREAVFGRPLRLPLCWGGGEATPQLSLQNAKQDLCGAAAPGAPGLAPGPICIPLLSPPDILLVPGLR